MCADRDRDERGGGDLGEAEQTDAGDLAGQEVAGGHAGEEHLDGAAGLLLHDAAEDHRPVGADGAEENQGHDEGGRLVVGAAPGDLAELDVGDRHRLDHGQQLVGVDARRRGPVADGDELDGAGGDGLELLVGLPLPLQTAGVDDEHVDLLVADRLLAGGDGVVAVDADRGVDRVALSFAGRRAAPSGIEPVRPMSLVPGPVSSSAGSAMAAATAMSMSTSDKRKPRDRPRSRISRASDQPALPDAVHAATA